MKKILLGFVITMMMVVSWSVYAANDDLIKVRNSKCIEILERGTKLMGDKRSGMILELNGVNYFVQEDTGCWKNKND